MSETNATTTGLTWTADKGLGTHGGFRCTERPLVILRDANRHYALYQDGAKGLPGDEVGHLVKGSLAKCKAEAEAFARRDADLAALDAHADAFAAEDATGETTEAPLEVDVPPVPHLTNEQLDRAHMDEPPTEAEVEAAYDRACTCLPEIEAAVPMPADEPPALAGEGEQGPDPTGLSSPAPSAGITAVTSPALASSEVACPERYEQFAAEAEAQGWTDDQLCECGLPELAALKAALGEDEYEAWCIHLLDDRTEQARSGRTEAQVQAAVDQLVWQHGRTNRPGLLAPFKLAPADLTGERLLRAEQNVKARVYADGPLTWHGPSEEQNGVGPMDVWRTGDGRYRIGRYRGAEPRFAVEARTTGARRLVANNLKSLEAALDAADNHYRGLVGEEPQGNRAKVLKKAEESGHDRLPRPEGYSYNNSAPNPSTQRNVMQVNEAEARQMLVAMGAKSHADSPRKLLTRVLNDLHNRIDAMKAAPQGEDKKLCDAILASLEAGEEIVVKTDPSNPSPEKESAMKNGAPKKNKTSPAKPAGGKTQRYDVLGHTATAALRFLGKKGWKFDQARKAFDKLGVECSDTTIKIQLRAGSKGERGEPAPVTKEQFAELKKASGE